MNARRLIVRTQVALLVVFFMSACSTPTLIEIARRRQATNDSPGKGFFGGRNTKDDVRIQYTVTDLDVLNFTDEVKRKLANRCSFHMAVRYSSAGTQATLGALAGAAKTLGWGIGTASGLGLGATYIFGMGQIFDSKAHAQAYEQAYTAVQIEESAFYFGQTGMRFGKDVNGKTTVILPSSTPESAKNIPYSDRLTPDGETLYYRVSKTLKVLADVLASKIPDLQDLKDSTVTSIDSTTSPAKPVGAPSSPTSAAPSPSPPKSTLPAGSTAISEPDVEVAALHKWWKPEGIVNQEHAAEFDTWLREHESGVDIATFLNSSTYRDDWAQARAALIR